MDTRLDVQPDFPAIKAQQNAAWSSGDYAVIGTTLQIVGETLAESMDLPPGARVLDVAAGNGNATLAFARRWHRVTSTDYVAALLDKGRARAQAEGLDVSFGLADAEALPFGDAAFDAVVSTFGVMFAPNQQKAAAELARTCRPGGLIGLASWTADGFIGQLFRTLGAHVAPPAGLRSPAIWGDRDWIEHTFRPVAAAIDVTPRQFVFRYRAPGHFIEVFRSLYGPVHKAFLSLDDDAQAALETDLLGLIARFDVARDGTMSVPGAYVECVIRKA
ncbi:MULTISPECIES: class I SAM-dependent methyltransferase [Rhodovulum]|uniref:Methyltransferase family protein n=2 Tax=Rhodovulum TaxID=34008 RepID=A0A8E2VP40_9RHOB|nr:MULTISPECIES: class I SAM-dependent methyltransferase [Rhodovulum]PTW52058.1 methyltransferase family protein [Rhodovulum kholense]RAP43205.1 SAM-dependent methyltransferase [Rhodovulum viride]